MSAKTKIKELLKSLRAFYLIHFKIKPKKAGHNFYCGYGSIIQKNSLVLGNNVYIGNNCHLSVDHLEIDDNVMFASQVSIVGGDHRFDVVGVPIRNTGRAVRKGVKIAKDCWVGHGVIILDGVQIGEGTIVAAGSVVTKSLEPYGIYAGIPAKKIRDRFDNDSDKIKHSKAIQGIYSKNETINSII